MIRELFVEIGEQTMAAIKAMAERPTEAPSLPRHYALGDWQRVLASQVGGWFGWSTLTLERDSLAEVITIRARCQCGHRMRGSVGDIADAWIGALNAMRSGHACGVSR